MNKPLLLLALLIGIGLCPAGSQAQNGYDLSWWSLSGGGESTGGVYNLNGSILPAESARMIGGPYEMEGGFWAGIGNLPPPGLCGDANLDETIDIQDAVLVLQVVVGLKTLTPEPARNANVNKDAMIDVADAVKILRIVVGLEPACVL